MFTLSKRLYTNFDLSFCQLQAIIAKFIFFKNIQRESVVLRSYSVDDSVRKDCRVTLWIRNFEVGRRLPLTPTLLKVPARSVAMGCNVNSRDLCNFFSKIRFIEKAENMNIFQLYFKSSHDMKLKINRRTYFPNII